MKIKGFTLIEFVIILAIVGFISAIIFPEIITTTKAHRLGMTVNEYREYQKTEPKKEIKKDPQVKLWR